MKVAWLIYGGIKVTHYVPQIFISRFADSPAVTNFLRSSSVPTQLSPVTLKVRGADERSTCQGGERGGERGWKWGGELILDPRNDWLVVPEWQKTGPLLGASVPHTHRHRNPRTANVHLHITKAHVRFLRHLKCLFWPERNPYLNLLRISDTQSYTEHSHSFLQGVSCCSCLVILSCGGDINTRVCSGADVTILSHYLPAGGREMQESRGGIVSLCMCVS